MKNELQQLVYDYTAYFIIINNQTGDALYDSWADILTFNSQDDAINYISDHGLEDTHHIDIWLDY